VDHVHRQTHAGAARKVCVPMTSPQWITASALNSFAACTARASGSARSWLSETMQIFNGFKARRGAGPD